jgi:hypothetical protein
MYLATLAVVLLGASILVGILIWGTQSQVQSNFVYRPLLAGTLSIFVLWSIVYAAWRGPLGWRKGAAVFLLAYVAIEQVASPHMSRALRMATYITLLDPDHRPRKTSRQEGWNSDSLRCPREAKQFREEDTNIIFLGDSFTFGMKLGPQECFPQRVEDSLRERFPDKGIRVANFAWVSSSPLLSWRRLQDIGEDYQPDLVVMCVDMTDIRDDIRWRAMLNKHGAYRVIEYFPMAMRLLEVGAPGAYRSVFRLLNPDLPQEPFFMSEAPLSETRPFFEDIVTNLARIEAWCEERAVGFAVVVLPRTYQYSARESPQNWEAEHYTVLGPYSLEPFRFFDELREQVDYSIYSLLETFRETQVFPTSFEDDPHWNPAGANLAAGAITRIVMGELGLD